MDIIPSVACWSSGHFQFVIPTMAMLLPFCAGIIHRAIPPATSCLDYA